MPELPDVELYVAALRPRVVGRQLDAIRLSSPFLLRSVVPPPESTFGRRVDAVWRLGKRIVVELEGEYFLLIHLMIAGRLRWRPTGALIPRRLGLAAFDFGGGTLVLTEAGTKKRVSLHVVHGRRGLAAHHRGGMEVLDCDLRAFAERLLSASHTIKRALCDPSLFSGIGNAYSDEILHAARLSPFKLTSQLEPAEVERLFEATQATLRMWVTRLQEQTGARFPDKVTAFRPDMTVHGKYGEPCPACEDRIQRIVYADNETNYCPTCQTEGRLLRDRALSRLLKSDWPRSLEELEERLPKAE